MLKDLTRDPGTFVNGHRIETAPLHQGDLIGIGGYQVRFNLRNAPQSRWPPRMPAPMAHRDGEGVQAPPA